jgi:hypothetical protein
LSTIAEAGGRFLSSDSGTWESVTLKKKKEKIGHAIRSAVTDIELDEAEWVADNGSEDGNVLKVGAESLVLLGAVAQKLANDGEAQSKRPASPRHLSQPTRRLEPNEVFSASSVQQHSPPISECIGEKSTSSKKRVTFAPGVGGASAFNVGIFRRQHLHDTCRTTTEVSGHSVEHFDAPIPQMPNAMCIDVISTKLRPQPRYPRSLRRMPRPDPTHTDAQAQASNSRRAHKLQKGSMKSRQHQAWESFHEQYNGDSTLDHSMTGDAATDASPTLVSSSGQPQLPFSYTRVDLQRQNVAMPQSLLARSMRGGKLDAPASISGTGASVRVSNKKRPLPTVQKHNIKSLRSKLPRLGTSPFARKITE